MNEVFIPLGGAGGKNRGTTAVLGDGTPFINSGSEMNLPLPAGSYKKSKSNPRADYGDGKNAEVTISVGLLRKMVLKVFGIASISNFSITPLDHRKLRITWARPNGGLWNGVRLVFKQGSLPTSIEDGFLLKDSADVYLDTEAMPDGMLFVRAFNYLTVSNGRWYDEGEISASIKVEEESGNITLSAGAGTWTVPDGVRKIRYILVGHGGAGTRHGSGGPAGAAGGGGGGGGYFKTGYMSVTPGQTLPWIVPSVQGQATVLNGIRAESGKMTQPIIWGTSSTYSCGGDGGSGGGAGAYTDFGSIRGIAGCGGENGSNGKGAVSSVRYDSELQYCRGGIGQGTSTTGFNGVIYCGGGGGWGINTQNAGFPEALRYSAPDVMTPTFEGGYYRYYKASKGGAGGGGDGGVLPTLRQISLNGTDGVGGGGGGDTYGSKRGVDYKVPTEAGKGGTGCIYIAWGKMMND